MVSSCLARKMLPPSVTNPSGAPCCWIAMKRTIKKVPRSCVRDRPLATMARVIVEDRYRVDLEVAQAVVEVADVGRPVLVPPGGLEGHRLGIARDALGFGQAVERTVEGQDAAARPRREEDPEPLEGRVDPKLAEQRVLLEL